MTLFQLLELGSHLKDQLTEKMKEVHGLTYTDWLALHALAQSPCTHGQLVTVLGMTKGGTTKVIQRLEKQDLLQVDDSATQRKGTLYKLTGYGESLVPRLLLAYKETETMLQSAFGINALRDFSAQLPDAIYFIKFGKHKYQEHPGVEVFGKFIKQLQSKKNSTA